MCKVSKILLPVAAAVGTAFLGPEVGAAFGIGDTAGGALAGAGLGALSSGIQHGNILEGAVTGGIGGAIQGSGILNDLGQEIGNTLGIGGTGAEAAGTTGIGGAPTLSGPTSVAASGGGFTSPSTALDLGRSGVETALGGDSFGDLFSGGGASTSLGSLEGGLHLSSADVLGQSASSGLSSGSQALLAAGSESAGSGIGDLFSGKNLLKFGLPVAEAAFAASEGPAQLPPAAQQLNQATGPLLQTEQQQLNAFNTGTLTAPQQAEIDQYKNNAHNQLIQQLASLGVTNPRGDSRYISGLQQIEQQAQILKSQALNQAFSAGTQAGNIASGNLENIAQMQNQADADYSKKLQEATQSLFSLFAEG